MNKRLHIADSNENLTLRGFQDDADYDIIAKIHNASRLARYGDNAALIDGDLIQNIVSEPDRLRIAEVDQEPVGFVFVARSGVSQLDEFGTIEGRSWLIIGPTFTPGFEPQGIIRKLLASLIAYAYEKRISKLIRMLKTGSVSDVELKVFEEQGFDEKLKYYFMQTEMTAPPPEPRDLPDQLKLISFRVEDDFDLLWGVLQPAFDYIEGYAGAREQVKSTFASMQLDYFPICIEIESGKPIGTIAMLQSGEHGQIATFGVIPSHQREGIGSLLMERAIYQAWQSGVKVLDLSVRVENPKAIRIYKRYGFEVQPQQTRIVLVKHISMSAHDQQKLADISP